MTGLCGWVGARARVCVRACVRVQVSTCQVPVRVLGVNVNMHASRTHFAPTDPRLQNGCLTHTEASERAEAPPRPDPGPAAYGPAALLPTATASLRGLSNRQ